MRTGTLVLFTVDGTRHDLEMFVFSWVNSARDTTDPRWVIEIAARNEALGQWLFHFRTSGEGEVRAALSAFLDKLLTALASSLETQITVRMAGAVVFPNPVDVDLTRDIVYLIVS